MSFIGICWTKDVQSTQTETRPLCHFLLHNHWGRSPAPTVTGKRFTA